MESQLFSETDKHISTMAKQKTYKADKKEVYAFLFN